MKQFKKITVLFFFSVLAVITAGAQLIATQGRSLFFRENKGQVMDQNGHARPDILISGQVNGLIFHLDRQGIHYQLLKPEIAKSSNLPNAVETSAKMNIYRVDIQWKSANPNPVVEYMNLLPGVEHFFNVPKGINPVLHVRSYREVRYKNIYPGIDVHFYEKDGGLEYDFEVAPHAKPENICMAVSGAELSVNDKKELCLKTPLGEIREGALEVWQGSQRIKANWKLNNNAVGFELGNYDPAKPLRIDPPVRVWGTYFGAADGNDYGNAVTTDQSGNVYMAGETTSTTNIATSGAHQTFLTPNAIGGDVYIAKFNSIGQLQWGTYFGGAGDDECYAIAVNTTGDIYIGGITNTGGTRGLASSFVTPGAFQTTYGGAALDGFLAKFTSGGFPQWVTYYGGEKGYDYVQSLALDPSGNIFIAGTTDSNSGIASVGSHQVTLAGDRDCFIAKFTSSGQRLWGTYFGGTGREAGNRIVVDGSGAVYLAGSTNSATGIATTGAQQTSLGGGNDAFLAKFDGGGSLVFCTYYGGSNPDWGNAVQIEANGNILLAGSTRSTAGISTPGAHQSTHAASFFFDAFLVKFDASGKRLWGTYYGGQFDDDASAVGLDNAGNIYLAGTTLSLNNISTAGAYQEVIAQSVTKDVFIVKFSSAGVRQWGTYYGGNQDESLGHFICTPSGELLLSGTTGSPNNIASPDGHQPAYSGGFPLLDAYLVKFSDGVLPVKLTHFAAMLTQGKVQLQWETTTELNASHFEIERQINNEAAWFSIGKKFASGLGNTPAKYQYLDTDIKLSGQYKYRLKMVDTDGSYTYSPVRSVYVITKTSWQVYPTVAIQNQVNLYLSTESRLNLVDMQGRVIKTYHLQAGNHQLHLPFAAGQYRLINIGVGENQTIFIK